MKKSFAMFLLALSFISYSKDTNKNLNRLKNEVKKYEKNMNKNSKIEFK